MERDGHRARVLDFILDTLDVGGGQGEAEVVDEILKRAVPDGMSLTTLVCLLNVSKPRKGQLPSREDFYQRVKERITRTDPHRAEAILVNLH